MDLTLIFNETNLDILFKLTLSVILGAAIGLDRHLSNKFAGIKTQVLVCLGSAIFTYLSINAFGGFESGGQYFGPQPARVAAQILTGIGFIGGGVILKTRGNVYGVTTAASLWMVASLGMAVGSGLYFIAILGTIFGVFVLVGIRYLEREYIDKFATKLVNIKVRIETTSDNYVYIKDYMSLQFKKDSKMRLLASNKEKESIIVEFIVITPLDKSISYVYEKLSDLENVKSIDVFEDIIMFD